MSPRTTCIHVVASFKYTLVKHDFKLGHLPLRIIIWKELYNDTTLKDQNLINEGERDLVTEKPLRGALFMNWVGGGLTDQ